MSFQPSDLTGVTCIVDLDHIDGDVDIVVGYRQTHTHMLSPFILHRYLMIWQFLLI